MQSPSWALTAAAVLALSAPAVASADAPVTPPPYGGQLAPAFELPADFLPPVSGPITADPPVADLQAGACPSAGGPVDVVAQHPLGADFAGGFVQARLSTGASWDGVSAGPGQQPVFWRAAPAVSAGSTPTRVVSCTAGAPVGTSGAAGFTLWAQREGLAPGTEFQGANGGVNSLHSDIGYLNTYAGARRLFVRVVGGQVRVSAAGKTQTIDQTDTSLYGQGQSASLGVLAAGPLDVSVDALGPNVQWRVQLAPDSGLSSPLTGVQHNAANAQTGFEMPFDLPYPGDVRAAIFTPDGTLVREALPTQSVPAGPLVATWDGTNTNGEQMPDGAYYFLGAYRYPYDHSGQGAVGITLDSTPPTVTLTPPPDQPGEPLKIDTGDALTGIADVTLTVDGTPKPALAAQAASTRASTATSAAKTIVYRPANGWTPGRHAWTITVSDHAGNTTRRHATFAVAGRPPARKHPHRAHKPTRRHHHRVIHRPGRRHR